MERFLQIILWIAGLVLVWYLLRPRYAFIVRMEAGAARLTRGKVTDAFLEDLRLACRDEPNATGWVSGVHRGRRVVLRFSRRIPLPLRQRLRNVWSLHES